MTRKLTLEELNQVPTAEFVSAVGGVFENSPWIAKRVADLRPFGSVDSLSRAMIRTIDEAGDEAQLALICAHPELAGKAALAGDVTDASKREQACAGLGQCTLEELARLHALNDAYHKRFGHPFILAVQGYDRHGILSEFERRVGAEPAAERRECLLQIARIGALRLRALLAQSPTSPGLPG